MTLEYKTFNLLKPLTSSDIAILIQQNRASEIVTHMEAYEKQREQIKEGLIKTFRLTCKTNKAEGLYISHPAMKFMKGGCNFNKHMLPAVRALVTDDNLRDMVRDYFQNNTEVDSHVIEKFTEDTRL